MSHDPSPIRAILFDFGGVIAEEGFANGLRRIAREQQLPVGDAIVDAAMDAVYDSGYVTGQGSEADFWRLMHERCGLHGEDAELSAIILDAFRVRPSMIERVRKLRSQGYLVGLLSDQTDWLERLDQRDSFFKEFDEVFNSYHLGLGKRQPELFDRVADRLGLPPASILFVDDNPGNVERARQRGWQAIRFENEDQLKRELTARLEATSY